MGTPDDFATLRDFLRAAGYSTREICRRYGCETIYDFRTILEGRPAAPELGDPVDVLVRLFMDAEPVECEVVHTLLRPDGLAALRTLALLEEDGRTGQCRGTVLLYPTEGLVIASDLGARRQSAEADVVYPAITTNTRRFISSLPTTPCESFLELCAGTGIAALLAAPQARHAWATDITERSTAYARFNAALNDITNVTAAQGDLYDAVPGLTFDRIVAHPPYMPSSEQRYLFRDGGQDGEQITRRIVAGLADYLRPGGSFFCTCVLTDRKGAALEDRIRAMLGDRAPEFDVIVGLVASFHPTEYYCRVAVDGRIDFDEVGRRHATFRQLEVDRIVYCSLMLRRRAANRPVATVRRQVGPQTRGESFEWLAAWEEAATDPALAARLLDTSPIATPNMRMRLLHRPLDGQWMPTECTLETAAPFVAEAKCPPWVAALIAQCDGTRSVRELLRFLQENGAIPPEAPSEEFAQLVQRFIGCGFLEIDGFRQPAVPA
jgi:SAM-dependent methyltransferase